MKCRIQQQSGCRSTKGTWVNLLDKKALQRGGLVSLQHELFDSVAALLSCWEMYVWAQVEACCSGSPAQPLSLLAESVSLLIQALWAFPLSLTYSAAGSGFHINNPWVITLPFLSIRWQMLTAKPLVTGALVLKRLWLTPLFSCRANIIDSFLPQQFVQVLEESQDLLKRMGCSCCQFRRYFLGLLLFAICP